MIRSIYIQKLEEWERKKKKKKLEEWEKQISHWSMEILNNLTASIEE